MTLLSAKKISKSFGALNVINSVDLEIEKGEIVGLIGPNGAGKTTFFNCITGYYSSDIGKVIFDGIDITKNSTDENCKLGMARTFQIVQPFGKLTSIENVMVGAFNREKTYAKAVALAEKWLDFVGLSDKRDVVVADLTIGDQRKLEMARALATGPKLLLLDEVMAGLTPTEIETVVKLVEKIKKSGVTILMIEHIMAALMKLSDRVIVLSQGGLIAEGTPQEISVNEVVIETYLGHKYEKKSE